MIQVTKTYLPSSNNYYKYIEKSFKSNQVTNDGPNVKSLEKRLAQYLNVKNIVLVANGTLALQLAYKALELDGQIITTPFSFNATAGSILWSGLTPVFSDIDIHTFNISEELIEKKITKNTSAIVPVHAFGNSCNVEKIDKIAKNYNLKVVYDAAQAFGVNYKGGSILKYGDASILSFHATKLFHTIEGGAIVTADSEVAKKIKSMINFGFTSPFTSTFNGINAKMSEFHAGMGLAVLDDIDYIFSERKKVWLKYFHEINAPVCYQKLTLDASNNYHYFPIVFNNEIELLKIQKLLLKSGFNARRYFFPSLDTIGYFKISNKDQCSNSIDLSLKILCLPIFVGMNNDIQSKIIGIINEAF
jgi:dTDP-4-amino-4,6-dideoxygalactose transaminase